MKFLIFLYLIFPFNSYAETSLWRVSKGNSELFIGGTIHVLSASDYPLPSEFELAYKLAKVVVLETDLLAMAQPAVQARLLQRVRYKNGKTLKDDLKPETYKALVEYAISASISIETLIQFKPPIIMITLLMTELQRLGLANTGVDKYFSDKSLADGKDLGQLESVDEQLILIESMGKGHEDEMILSTIAEMEELSSQMEKLKDAWRQGNTQKMNTVGLSSMKTDFPELYQNFLVDRNNAWLPKIEAMIDTPEIELILVGALHLVSNDGLINKLQLLGYTVEHFKPN